MKDERLGEYLLKFQPVKPASGRVPVHQLVSLDVTDALHFSKDREIM
jgi:hypothetical protein